MTRDEKIVIILGLANKTVLEEINYRLECVDRFEPYDVLDSFEDTVNFLDVQDGVAKSVKDNIMDIQIAIGLYRPQTIRESKMISINQNNRSCRNWDLSYRKIKYMFVGWG